jgi:hypothetical protein
MNAHTATVMATPYVRQADTRHGMVAAILTARVIILADALYDACATEDHYGWGDNEEAYRAAQEARIAAEEDYHRILRLAEAYVS